VSAGYLVSFIIVIIRADD